MICEFCNKTNFISRQAFAAHRPKCRQNPNATSTTLSPEMYKAIGKINKDRAISKYNQNPKLCSVCQGAKAFDRRNRLTCSDLCRSKLQTSNNLLKYKDPEFKAKKTASLMKTLEYKAKCSKKVYNYKHDLRCQYNTVSNYTKIYKITCSHCECTFLSRCKQKYCKEHAELYKSNQRNRFVFTFNVYHYPELFDLNFLTKHKWRCSKNNPNGVTRDHKVSVNEAIRNDYDPYYIRHPLNCELMLFNENNKKKHYSSMTYAELIQEVDAWDANNASRLV